MSRQKRKPKANRKSSRRPRSLTAELRDTFVAFSRGLAGRKGVPRADAPFLPRNQVRAVRDGRRHLMSS